MASAQPRTTQAAHDDLDDLFNYNVGTDDPLQPPELNMDAEGPPEPLRPKPMDLGLDEEVKQRTRRPNPKLDEDRLLSKNGIPKLRRITRERLKFKGKGHEFSDVARLLNLYQLWLDDLYPKAKFADGLAMIEKLGHSKSVQTRRKEWMKETETRHIPQKRQFDTEVPAAQNDLPHRQGSNATNGVESTNVPRPDRDAAQVEDALFVSDEERLVDGDGPEGDELDELMAEAGVVASIPITENTERRAQEQRPERDTLDDMYADEMEMMQNLEDW